MISIYTPKDNVITKWSGGQTNQLFLWPEDADFKSGNFAIRISTATVEIEESTFTKLSDINRTLIVLEGGMKLKHKDHHEKLLVPYEMDQFSGSWHTQSFGKCVDFNLMTKGNIKSEVTILNVAPVTRNTVQINGDMLFLYSHKSRVYIEHEESYAVPEKSLIVFKKEHTSSKIILTSQNSSRVICIQITF